MSIAIIIPARYESSRFPGKPLAKLVDKTLIQRTYETAQDVNGADAIYVATDDKRIKDHVESFETSGYKRGLRPELSDLGRIDLHWFLCKTSEEMQSVKVCQNINLQHLMLQTVIVRDLDPSILIVTPSCSHSFRSSRRALSRIFFHFYVKHSRKHMQYVKVSLCSTQIYSMQH